jgi:HSP20 family protein
MAHTIYPRWSAALPRAVQREMDQMFEQFFGNANGNGNGHGHVNGENAAALPAPAALWEEEGRWCVEVDLPGVKLEDVDITLEKNALSLTAVRQAPQEDRKFWHQERGSGQIQRLITLPETVDPDRIEAELKDGVLRLSLAKRPELQPRKIQIKSN